MSVHTMIFCTAQATNSPLYQWRGFRARQKCGKFRVYCNTLTAKESQTRCTIR